MMRGVKLARALWYAAVMCGAMGFGSVAEAASQYPLPSFYQVPAAMLSGGSGIAAELCNPTGDGVTCHLVVDAGTGFAAGGGGSTTFPYGSGANQTATAASFLGVGGYDGAGHFQPWSINASGVGSVAVSGSVAVTGAFYQANQPVSFASAQPVTIASTAPVSIAATVPVSGTFFQATQPVSIASSVPVTQTGSVAVTGTFYQASQPVTLPTTQPIQIQNGANVAGVGSNGAVSVQGVAGGVAQPVSFASAQPVQTYQNSSGLTTPVACDSQATVNMAAASTSNLLVSGVTGKRIYVCSYAHSSASTAGSFYSIRLQYGTTTTTPCDTGSTVMTYTFFIGSGQQVVGNGLGTVLSLPVGVNLCALTGSGPSPQLATNVSYALF